MKKYILGILTLFVLASSAAAVTVIPPYYANEQYKKVSDTWTWTNPAPDTYYYRGDFHLVNSSWVAKASACPEGVVMRASGTVEAKDIRATRLFGDGSGISGIIGGAVFALQADVAASTAAERSQRIAQDVLIGQATGQVAASVTAEAVSRAAGDALIGNATGQLKIGLQNEITARQAADILIGGATGQLRVDLAAEIAARVAAGILTAQATSYLALQDAAIKKSTGIISGMEGAGAGDILIHDGTRWSRLSRGSEGQIFTVSGASAAWKQHIVTEYKISPSTGMQAGTLSPLVRVTTASLVASGIANTNTFLRGDGSWQIIIGTQAFSELFLSISSGAMIQANKAEINALHVATATEISARLLGDQQNKIEIDQLHLATATERSERITGDNSITTARSSFTVIGNAVIGQNIYLSAAALAKLTLEGNTGNIISSGTMISLTNAASPAVSLTDTTNGLNLLLYVSNTNGGLDMLTNHALRLSAADKVRIVMDPTSNRNIYDPVGAFSLMTTTQASNGDWVMPNNVIVGQNLISRTAVISSVTVNGYEGKLIDVSTQGLAQKTTNYFFYGSASDYWNAYGQIKARERGTLGDLVLGHAGSSWAGLINSASQGNGAPTLAWGAGYLAISTQAVIANINEVFKVSNLGAPRINFFNDVSMSTWTASKLDIPHNVSVGALMTGRWGQFTSSVTVAGRFLVGGSSPTYQTYIGGFSDGLGLIVDAGTTSNFIDFATTAGSGNGNSISLGFLNATTGARRGYIQYNLLNEALNYRVNGVTVASTTASEHFFGNNTTTAQNSQARWINATSSASVRGLNNILGYYDLSNGYAYRMARQTGDAIVNVLKFEGDMLQTNLGQSSANGWKIRNSGDVQVAMIGGDGSHLIGVPGYVSTFTALGAIVFPFNVTAGSLTIAGITQAVGYNPVLASSEPAHQPSIATVDYVGIATMTVTLKGGRPAMLVYDVNTTNGSGASRDYTFELTNNSLLLDDEHILTNPGLSSGMMVASKYIPSTTAGVNTFCINVKSSSATGAQTARDIHINIVEY